jgi:hypothetical protein
MYRLEKMDIGAAYLSITPRELAACLASGKKTMTLSPIEKPIYTS